MYKKLYDIISKVFSVQISEINDESSPETIESWDSFNGLILVDELESNFNIKFSVSEIIDVKNVKDIKKYLKKHGVDLNEWKTTRILFKWNWNRF